MHQDEALKEIYALVYDATTKRMPNFGGHHGIYGHQQHVGQELLRATALFVAKARAGKVTTDDVDQFRGQCSVARATDTLAESDMQRIDTLLDTITT